MASERPFTLGWRIAIVIAVIGVLANGGVSNLREREEKRFHNHEDRIDKLEIEVLGQSTNPADAERSHLARIESLEERLELLEKRLREAETQ